MLTSAIPNIMTNLIQPIITCLETCQNLEIDFLSTTRQPLQSIQETAVAHRHNHIHLRKDLLLIPVHGGDKPPSAIAEIFYIFANIRYHSTATWRIFDFSILLKQDRSKQAPMPSSPSLISHEYITTLFFLTLLPSPLKQLT